MGSGHTLAHDDVDPGLFDLVERLAGEFEKAVGIRPVVDEVQRARDRLRFDDLDEAEHLPLVESIAHNALADLTTGPVAALRRPHVRGRLTPSQERGATAVEYALIAGLVAAVLVAALAALGARVNDMFLAVAGAISP